MIKFVWIQADIARNKLSVTARASRRYVPTWPPVDLCSTANESVFPMIPVTHTMQPMINKTTSHSAIGDKSWHIYHIAMIMSWEQTAVTRMIVMMLVLCLVVTCTHCLCTVVLWYTCCTCCHVYPLSMYSVVMIHVLYMLSRVPFVYVQCCYDTRAVHVVTCTLCLCTVLLWYTCCTCCHIGNVLPMWLLTQYKHICYGTVLVAKCSSMSQLFLPIVVVTIRFLYLHSTPTVVYLAANKCFLVAIPCYADVLFK